MGECGAANTMMHLSNLRTYAINVRTTREDRPRGGGGGGDSFFLSQALLRKFLAFVSLQNAAGERKERGKGASSSLLPKDDFSSFPKLCSSSSSSSSNSPGGKEEGGRETVAEFLHTFVAPPPPSPFSKRRARLHYYYTTTNSTIGCKQARLQGFEERLALLQLHSPVLTGSPSFFPEIRETTCVEPSLLSLWASVASCTWCEKE